MTRTLAACCSFPFGTAGVIIAMGDVYYSGLKR
jgi:hypothetical protein